MHVPDLVRSILPPVPAAEHATELKKEKRKFFEQANYEPPFTRNSLSENVRLIPRIVADGVIASKQPIRSPKLPSQNQSAEIS